MSSSPPAEERSGSIREAVPFTRLPWIRPLVSAYAHDFPSVAPLFAGNPAEAADWRRTIARVQAAPHPRGLIARVLMRQLSERTAPAAAQRAAAALALDQTVAVVTGQQATVFGGALYTLLKAVTAIQIARDVEETEGVRTVPVFWVDAEDHDWDEVRTAEVLDRDFAPVQLSLDEAAGSGPVPVGARALDERVDDLLTALEQALPPTEFTADVMGTLRARYRPGVGIARAFAGWLDDLLGHHGLVVFEANDAEAKPAVAAIFAAELNHPSQTARLALDQGRQMAQLGHAPQVEPSDDAVCLFYMDDAGRRPIKRQGGHYLVGDAERSIADLSTEATAHPERFSPNVLLRPIVQDTLFPTICYVAGPSELAYQAQLGPVYAAFGVEVPLLASRASATLIDSAAAKFFDKYAVPLEQLKGQDESALNRLLEGQLPAGVEETFSDAEHQFGEHAVRLKDVVSTIDPTLAGAVDTTVDRIRETLKNLQNKIVQASKKKDDTLRRQFMRTRSLTFPGGTPQERAVSVTFFINRYGRTLSDRLLDVLPKANDAHYVVNL